MVCQNEDFLLKNHTQRWDASAFVSEAHAHISGPIEFIIALKHLYVVSLKTSWEQQAEQGMACSLQ